MSSCPVTRFRLKMSLPLALPSFKCLLALAEVRVELPQNATFYDCKQAKLQLILMVRLGKMLFH